MPVARLMDLIVTGRDRARAWLDRLLFYPFLRVEFHRRLGYWPHLRTPRSHNEKIQWRKLFDRNPLFIRLSDKLAMRAHVAAVLGPDLAARALLPLLHQTAQPRDLPFDDLPADIAIKANHGCGWNILLRAGQTVDRARVIAQCARWLRLRHGIAFHEWAYWQIPPRIIVEPLLIRDDGRLADDCKLHMFDGECRAVQLRTDVWGPQRGQAMLTPDWQPLPFALSGYPLPETLTPPPEFALMLDIARRLASGLDYVRIDFLVTERDFALNEITLYRSSGLVPFRPRGGDFWMGELWQMNPGPRSRHDDRNFAPGGNGSHGAAR